MKSTEITPFEEHRGSSYRRSSDPKGPSPYGCWMIPLIWPRKERRSKLEHGLAQTIEEVLTEEALTRKALLHMVVACFP